MSSTNANFRAPQEDYLKTKNLIQYCLDKYPEYVKKDFEFPPLTIEIDEGSNPPVGSLCWFINRTTRGARVVNMNQTHKDFKKEFGEQFKFYNSSWEGYKA